MRNVVAIILFLMSTSLFGQQTDTIGEYFLQPIEVQKNDNLWKLAERHYHDGRQYSKFWTVSKTKGLTNNPDSIYPGMVLYKLAKRTRLPDYHEEKFDFIYASLEDLKNSHERINSSLKNLEKNVFNIRNHILNQEKTEDDIWTKIVSFLVSIIASLIASFLADKLISKKHPMRLIFKLVFPLLVFFTTLSFLDFSWGLIHFSKGILAWLSKVLLIVLLAYAVYLFLNKESERIKEGERIKKETPGLRISVIRFFRFLIFYTNDQDKLRYWIGYWNILGVEEISDRLKILQTQPNSQISKTIIDEIEAILKELMRNN